VELDLGDSGIAYSPGDLLAILPRQRPDAVTALLQRCGLDPQSLVQVERLNADGTGSESHMTTQVGMMARIVFVVEMWRCRIWSGSSVCSMYGWPNRDLIEAQYTPMHTCNFVQMCCCEMTAWRLSSSAVAYVLSQVRLRALVAGALDVAGASPRRYFFEVLRHFATDEREQERLQYLSTPEGRNDLYTYNQREGVIGLAMSCSRVGILV